MLLAPPSTQLKVEVWRVPLDRGGYTRWGQYFGVGEKLWEYEARLPDERGWGRTGYVRAPDVKTARALARAEALKRIPR